MQASGGDAEPVRFGVVDQRVPDRPKVLTGVRWVVDTRRLRLDNALEQFVVEPTVENRRRLRLVDEFVRARRWATELVDDVELLFDAERPHPGKMLGRTRRVH